MINPIVAARVDSSALNRRDCGWVAARTVGGLLAVLEPESEDLATLTAAALWECCGHFIRKHSQDLGPFLRSVWLRVLLVAGDCADDSLRTLRVWQQLYTCHVCRSRVVYKQLVGLRLTSQRIHGTRWSRLDSVELDDTAAVEDSTLAGADRSEGELWESDEQPLTVSTRLRTRALTRGTLSEVG